MKIYHYLYQTTNIVNGKIYIGIHSTEDLNDGYLGSGTILKKAINKHGKENFNKEILEFCKDRNSLLELEKTIIDHEFLKVENCYNLTIGGSGYPFGLKGIKRTSNNKSKSIKYFCDIDNPIKLNLNKNKLKNWIRNCLENNAFLSNGLGLKIFELVIKNITDYIECIEILYNDKRFNSIGKRHFVYLIINVPIVNISFNKMENENNNMD